MKWQLTEGRERTQLRAYLINLRTSVLSLPPACLLLQAAISARAAWLGADQNASLL